MPIEFSQATGLSGHTKLQLESTANRFLSEYSQGLNPIITDSFGRSPPAPILDVHSVDVNPLIRRLPGQKENRTDEPWQRFKHDLPQYLHDGLICEKITRLSRPFQGLSAVYVDGTDISSTHQEAANREFESEMTNINNQSLRGPLKSVPTEKTTLKEQYESLFDDGQQHPEFTYKVAQTLDLFPNRPTKADLDTVPSILQPSIDEIEFLPFSKERKNILRYQALDVDWFSSKYHRLNGEPHDSAP